MKDINVCYATSDLFAPMTAVSMMSVIQNKAIEENIRFYIIGEGLKESSCEKLQSIVKNKDNVNIFFIDEEKVKSTMDVCFEDAGGAGRQYVMEGGPTYIGYSRIILQNLLPEEVDRVLFMGADTMINGSLSELFEIDLEDYPIAMCYDTMSKYHKPRLGRPYEMKYCNDDVVLINIPQWIKRDCTKRVLRAMAVNKDVYNFLEQDGINCVLEGEIYLLPLKYNVMAPVLMYSHKAIMKMYGMTENCYYNKREYDESKMNPVIYHFAGNAMGRPWYSNSRHIMKRQYDEYYFESPFSDVQQRKLIWKKEYSIQTWCFEHLPSWLNDIAGVLMQKTFGFFFVRNQK